MATPDPASALWASAMQLHRAGRLPEAEAAYRNFLARSPGHAEGHHMLGLVLGGLGRRDEALASIDQALALQPDNPAALTNRAQTRIALGRLAEAQSDLELALRLRPDLAQAWNSLGTARQGLGDAAGAEQAYRKAIALKPDFADAFYNLGLLQQSAGRNEEAIAAYRKAIGLRPQFAAAHNNLGNALRAANRDDEALTHYEAAMRIDPALGDAFSNYGLLLQSRGQGEAAVAALETAVRLRPDSAVAFDNLGIAYHACNRYLDAEAAHRRALGLDPQSVQAFNNLGNALASQGRAEEALQAYRTVLERAPDNPDAHSNIGLILHEQHRTPEAIERFERALAIKPDHFDALNNLGYLLQEQGRRRDAMALYRRALAVNPRAMRAAYNLGLAHLCEFEFAEGWPLCESRFETVPPTVVRRKFDVAPLAPADLAAAHRVAIWKEQGIGDQLLHATQLPDLRGRGIDFVLEVDPRLKPAYARAHPDWALVDAPADNAAFAGCDRHVSTGSLGRLLRPTRESFAAQPRALLAADPARRAAYRERLAEEGRRLVAISWRSFQPRFRGFLQGKKTAPLEAFAPIAARADVRLLDVQYGDTVEERAAFAAKHGDAIRRLDELDLYNDLEGVLAAIDACDLVLTTSNVTAHFGGVLGKPTWLLYLADNPPFPYWTRDGADRALWYPSVRIVTGRDLDDWPKLMSRVHELLDA
jgi:tetratricopeptide (TPR) repeat protein